MSIVRRNNVHVVGSGEQAMILAHGYGCDQNMWRYLVPAFAGRFRVVLFDYVGAGQSDLSAYRPARYATLDGYASDVLEICDELRITDAIFVGHSISAMIGVRAAILEARRFDRLVHIAPSARYMNDDGYRGGFSRVEIEELLNFLDENHLGWSHMMAPLIMGNPERPELAKELENSFCRTDPDIARRWARVCFLCDCRDDLPVVPVPSLVLQCRQDVIAPYEAGHYVHENLPDSRFVLLDATGHCPHLSHPDQVAAAMEPFVSRESLS
ncbi:MAG: alpha/beta hydrolase [Polyangiaceae bacterium]